MYQDFLQHRKQPVLYLSTEQLWFEGFQSRKADRNFRQVACKSEVNFKTFFASFNTEVWFPHLVFIIIMVLCSAICSLNENQIEADGGKKGKVALCCSAFNACCFNKHFKEICSTLGCQQ